MSTGSRESRGDHHHDHSPPADGRKRLSRWRCPNCGQIVFNEGDHPPPDFCAYCTDLTTWKRIQDDSPGIEA